MPCRKVVYRQGNIKHFMKHVLIIGIGILIVACNNDVQRPEDHPVVKADSDMDYADSTKWPASFGLGRQPARSEIAKIDLDVRPDGEGLPEGEGSAIAGKAIYMTKCMACHGTDTTSPDT